MEMVTAGTSKILSTSMSFTGDVEGVSSQFVLANPAANIAVTQFTQRVNKKHSMPFGEHIREATDIIKGHKN